MVSVTRVSEPKNALEKRGNQFGDRIESTLEGKLVGRGRGGARKEKHCSCSPYLPPTRDHGTRKKNALAAKKIAMINQGKVKRQGKLNSSTAKPGGSNPYEE